MLIYSQDKDLVVNTDAVPRMEIETDYNEGNYKIWCLCCGNPICIGEYSGQCFAKRVFQNLCDAYRKKKRIFYMP